MKFFLALAFLLLTPSVVDAEVCKATAWGDPHLVTWDGLKYDAQPKGEAIFLISEEPELEIQGRLEKAGVGGADPAVTTGITVDGPGDSPTIQVSIAQPEFISVAGFGSKQDGFCVKANGRDQNSGVIKLDSIDYYDQGDLHKQCLEMCATVIGVTGCEMIWDQGNRGCYAHTDEIDGGGNGVVRHSCYLVEQEALLGDCTGYTDIPVGSQNCEVELVVDGEKQSMISYDSPSATVSQDGRKITIDYPGVVKVKMSLSVFGRCYFSVDFELYDCDSYADSAIGLLGSPNSNSTDDWMDPNGNVLELPSGGVSSFFFEPAFNYVQDNWIITNENDSIFTYDVCASFDTVSVPDQEYNPEIEEIVNNPPPEIAEICGDDLGCIIDGVTLGEGAADEFIDNPAVKRQPVEEEPQPVILNGPEDDNNVNPGPGSGSGDPHFKTWTGDKYDYHGECDLVLVDHPSFSDGLGLKVHIRTTRVKYFSYISNIAVQIGDDVLEFDNDVTNFLINGETAPPQRKHVRTLLGGFHVRRDPKAISIRFDDHIKARIDLIQRSNGWPAVVVDGATTEIFKGSLGLLGDWETGKRLARDGKTLMDDPDATDFALEWQVRDTEPMLFKEVRFPQYPRSCTPPAQNLSKRLGVSNFEKEAEKACAHWKEDIEDCIFDVIATRDVMVAAEGHIGAIA
jgi:hypothetical protein